MRAVVQRVKRASLQVQGQHISQIEAGLVCYLGIAQEDTEKELKWLARKVAGLRIFCDTNGKMNISAKDADKEIMVVSQFTLHGEIHNGYRPSFSKAEKPEIANKMYEQFCVLLKAEGIRKVARGVFAADMQIEQLNDGPVTIIIDTRTKN